LKDHPAQKQLWALAGWFVTFHFVVIGWVWFALPGIGQSADVLGKLFGM
jgi:D-alanyl-lipoteichoic acid acyltransferase DltB (MBOAT superfamily)